MNLFFIRNKFTLKWKKIWFCHLQNGWIQRWKASSLLVFAFEFTSKWLAFGHHNSTFIVMRRWIQQKQKAVPVIVHSRLMEGNCSQNKLKVLCCISFDFEVCWFIVSRRLFHAKRHGTFLFHVSTRTFIFFFKGGEECNFPSYLSLLFFLIDH